MTNGTARQRLLKWVYPVLMKLTGKRAVIMQNKEQTEPQQSFYTLKTSLTNGSDLLFKTMAHKKVLLVNTASDCGYTAQYKELQQLQNRFKNLAVIGFPSNDFKEQERGTDEEIARFCQLNYGVTFPLAKKSVVSKADCQNEVFSWLSTKNKNGWNNQAPSWNFSKYLINENGVLTHYFDPSVSPLSSEVVNAINA